uniref:Uncharacterized protein n=1 Tax=Zea mays TaxID=4577 RepID=A0A804MIF9_MAIZE
MALSQHLVAAPSMAALHCSAYLHLQEPTQPLSLVSSTWHWALAVSYVTRVVLLRCHSLDLDPAAQPKAPRALSSLALVLGSHERACPSVIPLQLYDTNALKSYDDAPIPSHLLPHAKSHGCCPPAPCCNAPHRCSMEWP